MFVVREEENDIGRRGYAVINTVNGRTRHVMRFYDVAVERAQQLNALWTSMYPKRPQTGREG